MKLSITSSESFTLTGQTIDKLIRTGNGDAALLYLYILRTHGQSTDKQAAQALSKSKGWVADATAALSRIGLLNIATDATEHRGGTNKLPVQDAEEINQPRAYTQDEVVAEIASGSDFTVVVDETSRRLGKPLTSDDTLRLYGIYDNLRLPPAVIQLLITHCINECRLSGDGRSPSVKYIEKAAYTWEREGIFTIEKAEEYLKAIEARRSMRGKMKQALQIRDREFSETEKRYVDDWINRGFEPDAVAIAYDKTILKTGTRSYPYMDKILINWDAKGLHTAQQVKEGEGSKSKANVKYKDNNTHRGPSREEMERMKKLREKM